MVEQTILATKSERKQTGAIRVSLMNGVPPRDRTESVQLSKILRFLLMFYFILDSCAVMVNYSIMTFITRSDSLFL
jgi:hypothetical protein